MKGPDAVRGADDPLLPGERHGVERTASRPSRSPVNQTSSPVGDHASPAKTVPSSSRASVRFPAASTTSRRIPVGCPRRDVRGKRSYRPSRDEARLRTRSVRRVQEEFPPAVRAATRRRLADRRPAHDPSGDQVRVRRLPRGSPGARPRKGEPVRGSPATSSRNRGCWTSASSPVDETPRSMVDGMPRPDSSPGFPIRAE